MADLTRCRGCGKSLLDCQERAVSIQYGDLTGDPARWQVKSPVQNTWGRMHERCFLLAIGDRRGVELAATVAAQ